MPRALMAIVLVLGFALLSSGSAAAATSTSARAGVPAKSGLHAVYAADETEPLTFGVATSGPEGPDDRAAFGYLLEPGAVIRDQVAVVNLGVAPLTVSLYAKDAINTDAGAFDVLTAEKPSVDVGTWIELAKKSVTVAPGSRKIVKFTVRVPEDATPGDHVGGIVASLPVTSTDADSNQVAIDRRVGSRVYLRVTGDLAPALEIADVRAVYDGPSNPLAAGSTLITYTLTNTGNVRLGARQELTVRPLVGGPSFTAKPSGIVEVLPGNSFEVTQSVPGVRPLGLMRVTVDIQPIPRPGDALGVLAPVAGEDTFWAISSTALLLLVLLLFAGVGWMIRRRQLGGAPSVGELEALPLAAQSVPQ